MIISTGQYKYGDFNGPEYPCDRLFKMMVVVSFDTPMTAEESLILMATSNKLYPGQKKLGTIFYSPRDDLVSVSSSARI
jgi:hypothetical protein